MRQYCTEQRQTKELEKIICNKCGKEIPVVRGVPGEDVLEVEKRWGYHSRKDNRVDRLISARIVMTNWYPDSKFR